MIKQLRPFLNICGRKWMQLFNGFQVCHILYLFNLINGASDFPSVAVLWYQKIGFLPVQVAHH